MNIMDSQWNHEANNFAMDNDYEKTFESYISDVDDEDGELSWCNNGFGANHAVDFIDCSFFL